MASRQQSKLVIILSFLLSVSLLTGLSVCLPPYVFLMLSFPPGGPFSAFR